jgi:hypothetical protein
MATLDHKRADGAKAAARLMLGEGVSEQQIEALARIMSTLAGTRRAQAEDVDDTDPDEP